MVEILPHLMHEKKESKSDRRQFPYARQYLIFGLVHGHLRYDINE
jgi:hypothetical protein